MTPVVVDAEKLAALRRMLAAPDERALRGKRGHRLTQPGRADRFSRTWFRAASVWIADRIAVREPVEGWKSAARDRVVRLFGAGR